MLGVLIGPAKRNQSDSSDWFRLRLASDASNWFRCRIGFACASNSVSFAPQRNHSAASDLGRKRNQSDASDWFRLRLGVVARVGVRSSVLCLNWTLGPLDAQTIGPLDPLIPWTLNPWTLNRWTLVITLEPRL